MKTKKLHHWLLYISLFLISFMYIDSYLIPLNISPEKVLRISEKGQRRRRGSILSYSYLLETPKKEYFITRTVYMNISVGDTVGIERSSLTGSLQKVLFFEDGNYYVSSVGFLRVQDGLFLTPLVGLGIILLLIFYNSIDNLKGRSNLTYALFISTIILLLFHLDLNF